MNVTCLCVEIISTWSQQQSEETDAALDVLPGFIAASKAQYSVVGFLYSGSVVKQELLSQWAHTSFHVTDRKAAQGFEFCWFGRAI